MTYQQTALENVLASEPSPSFPADFRASLTALQENVVRLMTSAICGPNILESFASLTPDGSWQKMYGGYCQASLAGFRDEFYGTWPDAGIVSGGIAFRPALLALPLPEIASPLLPRPGASEGLAWMRLSQIDPMSSIWSCWQRGKQDRTIYYLIWYGLSPSQSAEVLETIMGFPRLWTDLQA